MKKGKIIATMRDLKTKRHVIVEQEDKIIRVQYDDYRVVCFEVNQFLLVTKAMKKAESQLLRG